MATITANFEYQGPDSPGITCVPPEDNVHVRVRRLTAVADTANLVAGMPCYLTGSTQASDMTEASDEYGKNSAQGKLYLVECMEHNPLFATTTDTPEFPNRVPNTSITLSNYAHGANTNIIVIPLEIGMRFWGLIGNDITADLVKDTIYNCVGSGIIGAIDDPTPDAVVYNVHGFRAVATVTNANWGYFEYIGLHAVDSTD